MGTRSSIAIKNIDGTIDSVYCHWNGFISGNGRILLTHYTDPQKVRSLIDLGDISLLGPEIGEQHPFDNPHAFGTDAWNDHADAVAHMTLFYGRDRGETGTADYIVNKPKRQENVGAWLDEMSQEYHYLFDGENWLVNKYNEEDDTGLPVFDLLEVALQKDSAEA